jgi:hypothetical protein
MSVSILMAALLAGQAATPAQAPALDVDVPAVEGLAADPTCGGRPALAQLASCFVTTQAGAAAVADVWNAAFAAQGWNAAHGDDNRVVYVRRREGGGCDAFQLQAFADDRQVPAPAAPAYLALGTIPGDICAPQPPTGTPATPATPQ